MAVQHHDDGWADVDESLAVDEANGRLLDFMEVSDTLKRETSTIGIARLASDPYAAGLVAQHRLHVYRRYEGNSDWRTFFADTTVARDVFLKAAAEARMLLASAPVVELKGFVGGRT